MIALDDVAQLASHDPGGMLQQVASLPDQLARAAEVQASIGAWGNDLRTRVTTVHAREVLVCGMGGSAIGGDYAATWAATHATRVDVWRGYGLPTWHTAQQLLVFSSYSGNTEETLSAFEASSSDAARVCVTTGGALARRVREVGVPVVELPGGLQPRAALGHSLVALLLLLQESGMVRADARADLESASRAVRDWGRTLSPEAPESTNAAKRLARACHARLPFFYAGGTCLAPVALRWKGQLNENAKSHAAIGMLPEMNHNEIMAWSALPELRRQAQLVFLHDPHDDARVERRMRLSAELLAEHAAGVEHVNTVGDDALQHMLTTTHLGDYASVYLAFLNQVDPTPVERIEALKRGLAEGS